MTKNEETLKNPALEIIKDRQVESGSVLRLNKTNPENIRIMNSARDDKSDAFQNFLENQSSPPGSQAASASAPAAVPSILSASGASTGTVRSLPLMKLGMSL